ncbi:MAG: putative lipid II flippase FtsW [Clostridia bacterium]|nr:putative lipid II flippase FtsW [Clostridia bacterium]
MKNKKSFDQMLFAVALILSVFGLIMVFSASSPAALALENDSFHYVKKQAIWAVLGIFVMLFCSRIDYRIYKKWAVLMSVVSNVLLALVLVIGNSAKGAQRWLGVGSISFQPSEFTKIAIVVALATYFAAMEGKKQNFKNIYLPLITILGIPCILLLLQPHFSIIIILGFVTFILMMVYKVKLRFYLPVIVVVLIAAVALVWVAPYRLQRITAYRNPFADPQGDGYQIIQSLFAIGSGGFGGLGLSRSRQKYLYIPEPQNDYIFSIVCEELGFIGALLVLVLFMVFLWRSVKIAVNARDSFGSYLAFGLCMLIIVQVALNILVVTNLIPPTGIPLPFFSAGGSAFIFQMVAVGIILNISKTSNK